MEIGDRGRGEERGFNLQHLPLGKEGADFGQDVGTEAEHF
jgi:hypothetical protein